MQKTNVIEREKKETILQNIQSENNGNGAGIRKKYIKRNFTKQNDTLASLREAVPTKKVTIDYENAYTKEKEDVEITVPEYFSDTNIKITAKKYLQRRKDFTENNYLDLFERVVKYISNQGLKQKVLKKNEIDVFESELFHILVNQKAAFNSPVWFNCGLDIYGFKGKENQNFFFDTEDKKIKKVTDSYKHPQIAACFIQSVEDSIESIFSLITNEARLFKYGSGSGSNFSNVRSKYEKVNGGGYSSGVLSYLKILDCSAGQIRSGGISRRAAKMISLDSNHAEILDFISWKSKEEEKAKYLLQTGNYGSYYDLSNEAIRTVSGQNGNNTVRLVDSFMEKYFENPKEEYDLIGSFDNENYGKISREFLLDKMSDYIWKIGDPGIHFENYINKWNTCKTSGTIKASNPCSEFLFLNDSSCNLASINLEKYIDEKGNFLISDFKHTCSILSIAQDILIDNSGYPTKQIASNSHEFRPIGLGFANIGSLFMKLGLPYDSLQSYTIASAISSLMTSTVYKTNAEFIAGYLGSFEKFEENKDSYIGVMNLHLEKNKQYFYESDKNHFSHQLFKEANTQWEIIINLAEDGKARNSQATVVAPTGTSGFFMDCDMFGIEPDFALVKEKTLIDGRIITYINNSVKSALKKLNYNNNDISYLFSLLEDKKEKEFLSNLKSDSDRKVFECANDLSWLSHIKMVSAVQPFISGGISKTVNLPETVTKEEIKNAIIQSYRLEVKCVAFYRNGSKIAQPLNNFKNNPVISNKEKILPTRRDGKTFELTITDQDFKLPVRLFLRTGEYKTGELGEIFINISKENGALGTALNKWAMMFSKSLRYNVPLKELIKQGVGEKCSPRGLVFGHENVKQCTSIYDLVSKILSIEYLKNYSVADASIPESHKDDKSIVTRVDMMKRCPECDDLMVSSGKCFQCFSCGHADQGCGA